MDKTTIEKICHFNGVDIVNYTYPDYCDGRKTVYILGSGAGLVMAYCDRHWHRFRKMGIDLRAADMPGMITLEQRVIVIDYVATAFPCILLLWSGLRSACDYVVELKERSFRPLLMGAYVKGIDMEQATEGFKQMGCFSLERYLDLPDSFLQDGRVENSSPRHSLH